MAYDRGGKQVQPAGDKEPDRSPVAGAGRAPGGRARAARASSPEPAPKVPLTARLRVLPAIIFLAALLLSVKVTAIWDSVRDSKTLVSLATYAEAKQPTGTGADAAKAKPSVKVAAKAPKPVQIAQAATEKKDGEKPLDPVLFTRSEIELLQARISQVNGVIYPLSRCFHYKIQHVREH
jgi:hypothetical protein